MKRALFVLMLALPVAAWSAPKVKQVDTRRQKVAATASPETTPGSEWILTTSSGEQCNLTVVEQVGELALLDGSDCDQLGKVKAGQLLTKNLIATRSPAAGTSKAQVTDFSKVREQMQGLSVFGLYSFNSDAAFKATTEQNQTVSGDFNGESAFGFGAEYEYLDNTIVDGIGLGITGGVTYETPREYTKIKVRGGQTLSLTEKPTLALWDIYANATVRPFNRLSGFFGFNYAIPLEDNFGEDKAKSGFGYQVGGSLNLTKSLAIDGIYRWINLSSNDIDELDLDGFVLRGRFVF